MKNMKRWIIITSLALVTLIGIGTVSVAQAKTVRSTENVNVAAGEVVDATLFASGTNINIEGTVNGDVFCAADQVNISGTINGDVFCAASSIKITGTVNGSVRAAASNILMNSKVTRGAMLAGDIVALDSASSIGQDVIMAGNELKVYGKVGRDVSLYGETANVGAVIGRNLMGTITNLYLNSGASVGGDVSYRSSNDLNKTGSVTIAGQTNRTEVAKQETSIAGYIASMVFFYGLLLVSLMIVSLSCVLLFPALFVRTNDVLRKKTGQSLLAGVLTLFVVPFVLIVLAVTFVGIPLMLLVLCVWGAVLLLSGPVAAYYIGSMVQKKSKHPVAVMALGSVIILVLYMVPLVNLLVASAVGLFGSGALVVSMLDARGGKAKPTATKA